MDEKPSFKREMIKKELYIAVRIEGEQVKTAIRRIGFSDDKGNTTISGILEIIGILENIKQNEMEKLKKEKNFTLKDGVDY